MAVELSYKPVFIHNQGAKLNISTEKFPRTWEVILNEVYPDFMFGCNYVIEVHNFNGANVSGEVKVAQKGNGMVLLGVGPIYFLGAFNPHTFDFWKTVTLFQPSGSDNILATPNSSDDIIVAAILIAMAPEMFELIESIRGRTNYLPDGNFTSEKINRMISFRQLARTDKKDMAAQWYKF